MHELIGEDVLRNTEPLGLVSWFELFYDIERLIQPIEPHVLTGVPF